MKPPTKPPGCHIVALLALFVCCSPTNNDGKPSPAAGPLDQPPAASNSSGNDTILGSVPESEPDLPPGTAVWIRLKDRKHSLAEFAAVARQRVSREEKSPPAAGTHVQIVLDPNSKDALAEVILGSGIGTPHWVITIDRELRVTSYKRALSRD
jgi:hypothetical protein